MFESRCGVRCDICKGKKEAGCSGCLNMTIPFWGSECTVKTCCEEKKLNHCGECTIFPCETLANMGKEEGFDPSTKIEQCREWLKE